MTLTQREREAAAVEAAKKWEHGDHEASVGICGQMLNEEGWNYAHGFLHGSQLTRVEELAVTAEEVFMACDWSSQENWDRIKSNPFNTATYERMAKRLTDLIRAKLAEEKEKTDG